nr:G1 family glutamic endopeptidase [uncultured Rhodopila sp.]
MDAAVPSATRIETSGNWSGAYITANEDRHFLQVWGSWKVPASLQLPPPLLQGPAGVPYICSNWIGLDGQRLYLDSSLPQVGTASTLLADGTTTAQAWTQWWARGDATTAPVPLGLAVNPGDDVLGVLTVQDPQTVIVVMVNLSGPLPVGIAVQGTSPNVTLPDGTNVTPDISGATAEWVLERPRVVGQTIAANFPDYGESGFELCIAAEGEPVDIFSLFGALTRVLRGERLIRMFDRLLNPERTQFISIPKKLDDTTIELRYGSF